MNKNVYLKNMKLSAQRVAKPSRTLWGPSWVQKLLCVSRFLFGKKKKKKKVGIFPADLQKLLRKSFGRHPRNKYKGKGLNPLWWRDIYLPYKSSIMNSLQKRCPKRTWEIKPPGRFQDNCVWSLESISGNEMWFFHMKSARLENFSLGSDILKIKQCM